LLTGLASGVLTAPFGDNYAARGHRRRERLGDHELPYMALVGAPLR
jgi:hypothetical protein